MAREAWLSDKEAQLITEFDEAYISCTYLQDLEKFAALVASAERERLTDAAMKAAEKAVDVAIALEREACAVVCDAADKSTHPADLAEAIRARGQA